MAKRLDAAGVRLLLATWAYTGYAPVAPAAVASFTAALGLIVLRESWLLGAGFPLVLLVTALAGFATCGPVEKALGEKDSHTIVIDDVLGLFLALWGFQQRGPDFILAVWLVVRVVDNLKPFPAGLIERRLKGAAGIMLDDVVTGLYVNAALRLLLA